MTLFITPVHAQSSTSSATPVQPTTYNSSSLSLRAEGLPSTVSPTSPLYTDLLIHNIFHTFSCLGIGQSVIGQPCLTYQMQRNAQGLIEGVPMLASVDTSGGVLGTTGSLIGALYTNRPVRTVDYLATVGQELGIVRQANAQVVGSGAKVLNPIVTLWQVSRNISYVIMIVIFVIIGLMVMFRTHINPQTVITAQAALPGLVIGLILITFSYFLAGLISDMAFVGTNVVGYYFSIAQRPNQTPQNLVQDLSNHNMLSVFSPFTGIVKEGNIKAALDSVWHYLGGYPQFVLTTLAVFFTAQFTSQSFEFLKAFPTVGAGIQAAITGISVAITAAAPSVAISMALAFIAALVLIYAMFKLLLRLINNFITIIFLTITAPFQFLFASLPGRQGIATSWILNMLANILAFPAVLAVLYFVAFLLGPDFGTQYCNQTGDPCPFKISQLNQKNPSNIIPLAQADGEKIVNTTAFPLFGGLNLDFITMLLAFGALVALPAIPDLIARSIGTLSQAGQLLGQEISGSVGAGRGFAGQYQQGIGAASSQAAQARGLFGTPAYMPTGFDPQTGKPTGWAMNPVQYQPSLRQKFQARASIRKAGNPAQGM